MSLPDSNIFITEKGEIHKYFKNIKTIKEKINGTKINAWDIRSGINYKKYNNVILSEPYLGELFYYCNKIDPRMFLQLKDEYKIKLDGDKKNIAIHLRKSCNCPYGKRPIMNGKLHCKCPGISKRKIVKNNCFYDYDYIVNSIKYCLDNFDNCHFIIFGVKNCNQFTASASGEKNLIMSNFKLYDDVLCYFGQNNHLSYELSITQNDDEKPYIYDFSQMSECDVIISSPSTFCFGASIMGKKNKFIIHNEKLFKELKKINDKGDTFWFETYQGGNDYYKVDKYI